MSKWLYPFERRILRDRLRRSAIALLVAFLILLFLDSTIYHRTATTGAEAIGRLESHDWYRALRIAGTLWLWVPLCVAWMLAAPARAVSGARTLASAALAGVCAEILQVVTGRLRPNQTDGAHAFKGLVERFQNPDNLAFPSSHTAVAFGAAFAVYFLFPRAGLVALLIALGCGYTRLAAGAHFASDVFGAAVVGYAVARLLRRGGWAGSRQGLLLP
jgi:membrane-associated phospholipid phosphatase